MLTVAKQDGGVSFSTFEPALLARLTQFKVTELVNLFWSLTQLSQGSEVLQKTLKERLKITLRSASDRDFKLLFQCFQEVDDSKFASEFLD
jgi:hypothetical protein